MSTPIVESIGAFIENAITGITVANGYNYDLSATRMKRVFAEDETFDDLKVYIHQGESESKGTVLSKTSPRQIKQEYILWAVCKQSDFATDSVDQKINKVRSDIEKKLCIDLTCGGYAKHLDILSTLSTNMPETGIELTIEITYTVQWDNPYVSA